MNRLFNIRLLSTMLLLIGFATCSPAQNNENQNELDERVQKFLEENRQQWDYLNIPYQDGQLLHDLIVNNNYQSALEIGTSTGHSTVWIAWALSKTGGKMVTIEIDEGRHQEAMENVKAAGLS